MTPRPRRKGRKHWPENLGGQKKGGVMYYTYRNPQTGVRTGMGTDFQKAVKAARLLNAQLMDSTGVEDLVRGVVAGGVVFWDYLETFKTEVLPSYTDKRGNPYAAKTLEDYKRRVGLLQKEGFASKQVEAVTRRDVSEFLGAQPGDRTANIYRQLLRQIFARAVAEGLRDDNPAEGTLERVVIVQRQRLPYSAFQTIRDAADPWYRNALDLALQTLQRREDLTRMRFDDIQEEDGGRRVLLVKQLKTEHHGTGNIRIGIGPQLQAVIESCRDDVLSPFLVHRRPQRRGKNHMNRRDHWTQVLPELLTREFARLRDDLNLFPDLGEGAKPTFHEIRALGADLYRDAGVPEASIQRLLGHSSEKMTRVYLDRHGEKWVDAEAGIDA